MNYACVRAGFGEPVCKQQCGACAEWDRRQAAQEALQWRHHAGAGAAHVLPHPDAREALCGAYQPGQWPDKWEHGDGGLRRCEVCRAKSGGSRVTGPCRCINPGPLYLHGGHCCLRDLRDTDPLPPCHPGPWRQLRDKTKGATL